MSGTPMDEFQKNNAVDKAQYFEKIMVFKNLTPSLLTCDSLVHGVWTRTAKQIVDIKRHGL